MSEQAGGTQESVPQTPLTLNELVRAGLGAGIPPKQIRAKLKTLGIRWEYSFSAKSQGPRERNRRMRQQGLCESGCGRQAPRARNPRMCDECLKEKWSS